MWVSIWTLSADPVHLAIAARGDGDGSKMGISAVVPLALQLKAELTDVWTSLLLIGR